MLYTHPLIIEGLTVRRVGYKKSNKNVKSKITLILSKADIMDVS